METFVVAPEWEELSREGSWRREGADTIGPQMANEHTHCPLSTWVTCPQHDKPSRALVAPGTLPLSALTDPEKRPPVPKDDLSRVVAELQPAEQFELDSVESGVLEETPSWGCSRVIRHDV